MKEYSDEMLINKYFDHDLNDQEQAEFDQRLANDPMFRAMLNDYAETEGMLLKLAFHAKEEERKKFMEEYEAFLAEESVGEPPSHVAKEPIRRSFWQKNKMWMSVAASVVVITIAFFTAKLDFSGQIESFKKAEEMAKRDFEKTHFMPDSINNIKQPENYFAELSEEDKKEIFENIPPYFKSEAEATASSGSKIEIFKPINKSKNIYFSIFNHKESIDFVWKGKEFKILDNEDNSVFSEKNEDNEIKETTIKPGIFEKNTYYLWVIRDDQHNSLKGVIYID